MQSCMDVWDNLIRQKIDPKIRVETRDILAHTLFVGPSRVA